MTMDRCKAFAEEQIRQVLAQSDLVIQEDTLLSHMTGWDSIKMLKVLVATEKKFKFVFQAREVTNLKTFGDLTRLIQSKLEQ